MGRGLSCRLKIDPLDGVRVVFASSVTYLLVHRLYWTMTDSPMKMSKLVH